MFNYSMSYVCHTGFCLEIGSDFGSSYSQDVKVHLFLTQATDLESLMVECQRNTNCLEMTKCQMRSRMDVLTYFLQRDNYK